ncbi:MAG: hypothetical protein ACI38A_08495 [Candidatus Ornithomonoglobus sp.]
MKVRLGILCTAGIFAVGSLASFANEVQPADTDSKDKIYEYTDTDGTTYQYTKEGEENGVTFYEAVTTTPDPALTGTYTDADGSVYSYKFINDRTAVCINDS